ncbi:MAG: hypothetical protein ACKOZY_03760 [Flavobacteriales bacterium]|jgi:hypothetical protein
MHTLEPYYNWRGLYVSSEDPDSPFFEREYSEFEFSELIYNHYIHPQWDSFGSQTLFVKVLYCGYNDGFAIMEFIGEWNDLLYNDIMYLKREVIEVMQKMGIHKFILIGENVLNYHHSDDSYYEEWFDEAMDEDGWIAMVNFRDHVTREFESAGVDRFLVMGGRLQSFRWRTLSPDQLFEQVEQQVQKRLHV